MSLFGGDSHFESPGRTSRVPSASSSPSGVDSTANASTRVTSRNSYGAGDFNALRAGSDRNTRHAGHDHDANNEDFTDSAQRLSDDDDDEDEYRPENDSGFDTEDSPSRPNRFTGSSSTWLGYTAAERQIVASLEQIESGDLAAHLYNAHALKERLRLPHNQLTGVKDTRGKHHWLKKGEQLNFTDPFGVTQRALVPYKSWTAWPLSTQEVPSPGDLFGKTKDDGMEEWTIGGLGETDPGIEFREELLAGFLREGKRKWRSREEPDEKERETELESRVISRGRTKRSKSVRSATASPQARVSDGSDVETDARGSTSTTRRGRRKGRVASPCLRPEILTDDDKARRILRPCINSMLSQFDGLAEAICTTRLNHIQSGGRRMSSNGATTSAASGTRERSTSQSLRRGRATSELSSQAHSVASSDREHRLPVRKLAKKSKAGTDAHFEPDHDSEKSYETADGMARGIRQKNPDTHGPRGSESEPSSKLGLMDWSEVLGIAAMVGWDKGAVSRTVQRCASLFREGMSFRTLEEHTASDLPPEPVHFTPHTVSAPMIPTTNLGLPSTSTEWPLWKPGSRRCPHTDCWGHQKEFKIPYRVIEHLKRVHGYDPRPDVAEKARCAGPGGDFLQSHRPKRAKGVRKKLKESRQ